MKLRIIMMTLVLALVASLSACQKEEEGTMEKMGKSIDKAAHDTKEAVKEAAEEVEEAVEDSND